MSNDSASRRLPILTCIVASLMLAIAPMPGWAEAYRPDWVPLTLIFWSMLLPRTYSIGWAWIIGLILDVATGSGDLAAAVGKGCPEAKVIGADFCAPMLECAQKRGLDDLIVADGMNLPFAADCFDALTIGYGLRNMENWAGAISEFSRVLKTGGKLVVLDFSLPNSKWLRVPYRFYLHRVLPLIAGVLTGNREAYAYLGDSIERFPSGAEMLDLIQSNGFSDAHCFSLMGGISSIYLAEKRAK